MQMNEEKMKLLLPPPCLNSRIGTDLALQRTAEIQV
jgi:hypothetical protein